MKLIRSCDILKIWAVLLLLFLFFENAFTQSLITHDKNIIKWVAQYPDANTNVQNGIISVFKKLLFGQPAPKFNKPFAVIGQNAEVIWVADQGYNSIFHYLSNKKKTTKFHQAKFSSLIGICVAANQNVYFTDSRLNKIFTIKNNSKKTEILNDSLHINQPTGIAYSTIKREIWVIETSAHKITILNENGTFIKSIGQRGNLPGEFNFPTSIWIDKLGDVFVVDAMNFRIQIFDKNGTFKTMFGKAGNGTGSIARPKGIATDSFGNIYVADAIFNTVQIFDKNGNFLYNFGKYGSGQSEFSMPGGIFIDDNNFIYVADSFNSRIQIFQLINEDQNNENTH